MKNLNDQNIYRDEGSIDLEKVLNFEVKYGIKFPDTYTLFIVKHNGARLDIDSFDFYDNVYKREASESIAFIKFENVGKTICDLLEQTTNDINDPDVFKFYNYFDPKIIPFGDTGGGDFICFDYRQSDNPSIILWCHDNYDEKWNRISFVANNFDEFINMLHEFNDED